MARILVHALAASTGGGVTYYRQMIKALASMDAPHEWIILGPAEDTTPDSDRVRFLRSESVGSGIRRAAFDQWGLTKLLRRERADLLLATGNFGMVHPPVPQVLLNRNALYFSREHIGELRRRRDFRELLQTVVRRQIALASIRASVVNITPTQAFADEIAPWISTSSRETFTAIPFGFDHDGFARSSPETDAAIRPRLSHRPGVRRVLLVSHYNYFRNFDTLLRAMALLKKQRTQPVELILTTKIAHGYRHHRYDTSASARLIDRLGLADDVTLLGPLPHRELPSLYANADIVVCPSYSESFGHPMVEAMACGRPVIAADRGVHREVCRGAAMYFSTFDAEQLAYRMNQILDDEELAAMLCRRGRQRAAEFSWPAHFNSLRTMIDTALKEHPVDVRAAA